MPVLAPKWEAVALALANGETQKTAYLAGGYKYERKAASRLCTRQEMKDRVAEIVTERTQQEARSRQIATEKSGVDIAWIELNQKYVVQLAMRGQPVRDREGRPKRDPDSGQVIYKPDLQAANQGLITLGRMKGAFIDRTEIGGPGDFARLSDAELQQKLVEQAKALGIPEETLLQLEWKPQEAAE